MAQKAEIAFIYHYEKEDRITVFYKSGRWKAFWERLPECTIPQKFKDYMDKAVRLTGKWGGDMVIYCVGDYDEARKQFDRARYERR